VRIRRSDVVTQHEETVDRLITLLNGAGQGDYIGENVSQVQHALQCAHFARAARADATLILAALLHDIGHICVGPDAPSMDGLGVVEHELIGARFLAEAGFGTDVTDLVAAHVPAKRYLCATKAAYLANLSEASRGTLKLQGGPMHPTEVAAFEEHPRFRDMLRVRQWDEMGKQPDLTVEGLEFYRPMLFSYLSQQD
jgi:phosphonate degradation associated HDIG domain protein